MEHSPHMYTHLSSYFTHVNFLFSKEDILTGNNVWKHMGWEVFDDQMVIVSFSNKSSHQLGRVPLQLNNDGF